MKTRFCGFYPFTKEQFAQLWKECFFIFDSSVLLNLYRYRPKTRDELLHVLTSEALKDRNWIPHQVGVEFFRNRLDTIYEQKAKYQPTRDVLREVLDSLESKKAHPFIDDDRLARFRAVATEVMEELVANRDRVPYKEDEPVLPKVLSIFDAKTGAEDATILERVTKEGPKRYSAHCPPGYKDAKKPEHHRFGDLIVWFQLMKEGKERKKSAILVTSDEKEDWFQTFGGNENQKLGPRPELIAEYHKETGSDFYLYSTEEFLKQAKEHLGIQVSAGAIEEVGAVDQAKTQYINLSGIIEGTSGASVPMFIMGGLPGELPPNLVLGRNLIQFLRTSQAAWEENKVLHAREAEPLQRLLGTVAQRLLPLAEESLGLDLIHARALIDSFAEISSLANVKPTPDAGYVIEFGDGRMYTLEGTINRIISHLRGRFPNLPAAVFQ